MSFLTSLRGLAAILVVLYHASYNVDWPEGHLLKLVFSQGFLAVDFFFVLSGFIIAYTYSDRFSEFTWSNYRVFLWKRFARIYPLHLFVMLLFVSITVVIFITGRPPDSRWYPVDGFFFKVLLIDAWWTGYATTWNVPSWSISAEWFVYLTFPCLLRPFVGASLHW